MTKLCALVLRVLELPAHCNQRVPRPTHLQLQNFELRTLLFLTFYSYIDLILAALHNSIHSIHCCHYSNCDGIYMSFY